VEQQKPDVRLLIDISGSMKQNDPNNLRIPALQLVTNLMPQGAEAGVWAFGRYINMLVPLAEVDSQWHNKATSAATKINSAGLFTNIGDVLQKSSFGWNEVNAKEKRSLILLTDGMVDISKDDKVNAQERKRIINQVLPRLKKAKVTVHTIALSQNADHELLKTLATETDGWYQAVDSADELQKVFLKIFEQSAARDSLPLTDNVFKVDASIEEMTLLVFKKDPNKKTRLITPDESVIEGPSSNGEVRWFSTEGYDLITIQKPQSGDWKIDADVDPDNRVMVVSKLGLHVADVPNNLLAGESIDYQLSLVEDGELITKPDFLELVDARLLQEKSGKKNRLAMFFDSGSSQFKQNFFTDSAEGVLNLTLQVKSPTFERTRNHAVNIYGSPLTHEIKIAEEGEQKHQVFLAVRDDIVKAETLKVSATVIFPNQDKKYLMIEDFSQPIDLLADANGGNYSVELEIKGLSNLGREFSVAPDAITFKTKAIGQVDEVEEKHDEPEEKIEQAEPKPKVETKTEAEEKPISEEESVKEDAEEPVTDEPIEEEKQESKPEEGWFSANLWLIVGILVNLVLFVGGFFVWKMMMRMKVVIIK